MDKGFSSSGRSISTKTTPSGKKLEGMIDWFEDKAVVRVMVDGVLVAGPEVFKGKLVNVEKLARDWMEENMDIFDKGGRIDKIRFK